MMERSVSKKKVRKGQGGRTSQDSASRSVDSTSRASSSTSVASSQSTLQSQSGEFTGLELSALTGGYDLRAHLRQILTFSEDENEDSDDDDEVSLESYDEEDTGNDEDEELQKLMSNDRGARENQPATPQPTDQNNSQALVPISEEEDIDSEEERELMKEIKDEITNNVRGEMKSELELYKYKMQKLEREADGKPGPSHEGTENKHSDLDNLEPKLKEAIIKMRKLDRILMKKIRKEKEVKRDRILLERRIRREIEGLHEEGKEEYKEVKTNEQKFLALELPSRHNEGVTVPDEFTGEEVFATQLNEDEYPGLGTNKNKTSKSRASGRVGADGDQEEGSQAGDTDSNADRSSQASGSVQGKKHRKNKKDFIKRNKQLAADAANMIAMTEEEKKRLDGLLEDVETIPEIPDAPGMLDDCNPFQLAVQPGEGFVPEQDDLRSLTSIDSRLKDLLPPDDYASIASSSMSHAPQHKLFTHTGVKHAVDWERRGERALFQNAEQRELNDRMAAIESELAKLKNPEEMELDTPRLGEDQLHDLIDQCVTSLSRTSCSRMTLQSDSQTSFADTESVMSHATTIDDTPRSPRSARQEILDNPPRLAPEVLQKLLSEAYHPLSKQLSTLREEDDEEDEGTPIPADVWKLISMEKIDENGVAEDSVNSEGLKMDVNSAELQSARNGYRTLSRASTASSLVTVSDAGRESRESQVVKLPEIDPTGTLVTQGPNLQQFMNNQRPDSSEFSRTPVNLVRNNLTDSRNSNIQSDSRMEIMSLDGDVMSPHPPPAREKREGSMVKSRTVTPATRVT